MMNAIQTKKEKGFTLIELVMVIVILGILAAFALPRFANFGTEARVASINGLAGSMRSAASIAHARQQADGGDSGDSVTLEGQTVTMVAGFPTADSDGIAQAAQISDEYTSVDAGGDAAGDSITYYIAPDEGSATTDTADQCRVTYQAANDTSGSEAPISVSTETDGC